MTEKISKNSQASKPFSLRSESASSTVVGAVLLLAIIVSVFSVVRIGYIPEWKNDAEYSHMNDVWEDMADLKSKIDLMTIALASDSDSPNTEITMSVPFHMGGGDVPLIGTIKSSGTLSVNKDECEIIINTNSEGNWTEKIDPITCGAVSYTSQNRYYVDQDFTYEGGALILSQGERSSMMLYPSMRFSRPANGYDVSIHVVEIDKYKFAPSDTISSNTGCSLRLTGEEFETLCDSDNVTSFNLTVNTDHPEAWYLYLKETMEDAKIKDYDYTLPPPTNNTVILTFPSESSSKDLNRLYVSKTIVKVEPGIGI
ncbi:hypothetical protein EO95_13485 [Methanosarcina sp. 1.H.T.1A.1]|uniref:DUF7289 family protein n=1 Tax=Methanosarcina sp. 1.H.T.1A.1 TaxID=1483602 RepID=UPI000622036A|nr:hypothetical protein [Methanosarcina sp. 1.H.T.1A.1]KKH93310.1 hypothetical protein EO95_13485 [Methanosarcina sp. 1.H.T.1A.1]